MIIHIVKNNESVAHILELYRLSMEELKSYNSHITDFNNLICGMKIKIPLLSEEVEQVLQFSEGFITPYYDKIREVDVEQVRNDSDIEVSSKKEENVVDNPLEEKGSEVVVDSHLEEEVSSNTIKQKVVIQEQPYISKKTMRKAYPGVLPPKSTYRGNEIPK